MKKHITMQQWDEIEEEGMRKFWTQLGIMEFKEPLLKNHPVVLPSIGQMIEFLGEDWHEAIIEENSLYEENDKIYGGGYSVVPIENICDALWKACKYKLKKSKQ